MSPLAWARRWRGAATRLLGRREPAPLHADWFSRAEAFSLHQLSTLPTSDSVDDRTWQDLCLDAYLQLLCTGTSLLGRQALTQALASGQVPGASPAGWPTLDAELGRGAYQACQRQRRRLRAIDINLADPLWGGLGLQVPGWSRHVWAVPVLGLAGVGLLVAGASTAAAVVLGTCAVLALWVALRLGPLLDRFNRLQAALATVLDTAQAWAQAGRANGATLLQPLAAQLPALARGVSFIRPGFWQQLPVLVQYANLVLMLEYVLLFKRVHRLDTARADLRQVYRLVAEAEALLCLAEHRSQHATCLAGPAVGSGPLSFKRVRNPLLAGDEGVDVEGLPQGFCLTGRNGSGKSTLLRTLGLNTLVARAFGFCYAQRARVPGYLVVSSIVNEDSLARGQSLYMAELSRLATIATLAGRRPDVLVIVDEVLRGTNPAEAVAVSAAVLDEVCRSAVVMVSSHHLVLATLLAHRLPSVCLHGEGHAPRQLRHGVLPEPNGIALMARYGFSEHLQAAARATAQWLAEHDTHPDPARRPPLA